MTVAINETRAASMQAYPLQLLTARQLTIVNPDFHNHDWFTSNYQSRAQKAHPEYYSLRTMLEAVRNSENTFQQFPVDERNMKKLARSIFVEYSWLQRDPTLAVVDGRYYIVGGRHRITAIATVISQLISHKLSQSVWSDADRQKTFDLALEQNVRCEVLRLNSLEDLLILITVDNDSRIMRGAETSHLLAQAYGADATSLESIGKAVLGHDLSPTEAVQLAAQNFVRRPSPLKPQTKQVIGQKVAKWVLFGTDGDKKLSTRNGIKVTSLEEFDQTMDKAWGELQELIEGQIVIAKNATGLANQIIERLSQKTTNEQHQHDSVGGTEETIEEEIDNGLVTPKRRTRKKSE